MALDATDRPEANSLFFQAPDLFVQEKIQQIHQHIHFTGRSFPVFLAERVKRQDRHTDLDRSFHDLTHGLDAGLVSGHAWQTPLSRPAAVAVLLTVSGLFFLALAAGLV